ncbi:hypothetical protein KUCAC02_027296 [Chaenocephalus aceratus]|uniref:Uncharacterized protein n=1 Tax=Chaenocephalus aceratus TaxID=36190 RepID=A0ACB9W3J8_CHAAC|nr:hypothetical protein KUCAC02_027296 [Chaenocephalus aceratus]
MYSSSSEGLLRSEDCSGSSHFWIMQRHEVDSNVSLLNLASEEDDEVQFDSKQRFLLLLNVSYVMQCLLILGGLARSTHIT